VNEILGNNGTCIRHYTSCYMFEDNGNLTAGLQFLFGSVVQFQQQLCWVFNYWLRLHSLTFSMRWFGAAVSWHLCRLSYDFDVASSYLTILLLYTRYTVLLISISQSTTTWDSNISTRSHLTFSLILVSTFNFLFTAIQQTIYVVHSYQLALIETSNDSETRFIHIYCS